MKLYIAGPMTGLPNFNFPAFVAAATQLRAMGHDVLSPHEIDSPAVKNAAAESVDGALDAEGKVAGETWADMLSRDVKIVGDLVDGLALLPNWDKSRGARLEVFVGLLTKKTFHVLFEGQLLDVPTEHIRITMRENIP